MILFRHNIFYGFSWSTTHPSCFPSRNITKNAETHTLPMRDVIVEYDRDVIIEYKCRTWLWLIVKCMPNSVIILLTCFHWLIYTCQILLQRCFYRLPISTQMVSMIMPSSIYIVFVCCCIFIYLDIVISEGIPQRRLEMPTI